MEDDLGSLRVGGIADVSVLSDERGRWTLHDNEGTKVRTDRLLEPLFCLRAGHLFHAAAPILPNLSADLT
jgi:dihydroorotase